MILKEALCRRYSARRFIDKKISFADMEEILTAGKLAPSAGGKKLWNFMIIENGVKQKIVDAGGQDFIKDTPVGILVSYDNRTRNMEYRDDIQSASAAIENMLLMATDLAIGSCWICKLPPKFVLRELLNIPDYYDPIAYIALGYSEEEIISQQSNGGWSKKTDNFTSFDNGATTSQIETLARIYEKTKDERYKNACLKGIEFTLSAQYSNGGFPKYYPPQLDYHKHITFNNDDFISIMKMFKNMLGYSWTDHEKIKTAFDKGIECILKCQIIDNGKLTVWCQQHDENDFSPVQGRAYELPSLCTRESANIVLFLMDLEPTPEITNSIQSAVQWFKEVKIPETPWARFYEFGTYRPIFANRKSKKFYSLAELDDERRKGYDWYNYEPQEVLDREKK